jgi:predicted enzyme related to lactoylglutathione lyase
LQCSGEGFKDTKAFSGFSVNDMQKAKEFYGQTLGLDMSVVTGRDDVAAVLACEHARKTFGIVAMSKDVILEERDNVALYTIFLGFQDAEEEI